jgi:glycosyltransferase involved in cell wall biosynthesis
VSGGHAITSKSAVIREIQIDNPNVEIFTIDPSKFHSIKGILYPDLYTPLNFWKMSKLVDSINPTHIHIATEGVLGITAKRLFDSRDWNYTTSFHTRWDKFTKDLIGVDVPFVKKMLRWFHSRSHSVLVTTPGMKEELEEIGIFNTVVWSRGVDFNLFSLGYGSEKPKPTLLSVGRVSIEKNLKEFCSLDKEKYNLVLVGDGPHLNILKEEFPHVNFVGSKRGQELSRYYQESDVFVFPSLSDTFGLVMIESMATGTPVAAYPVRVPIDVVDIGDTGFLEEDLETAIQKCLSLNREDVRLNSLKWNWNSVSKTFMENLVPIIN